MKKRILSALSLLFVLTMLSGSIFVLGSWADEETEYDLSGDGVVNISDASVLLNALEKPADQIPEDYDLNADGLVSVADATVMLGVLGSATLGVASVPGAKTEPINIRVGTYNIQNGAGVSHKFKVIANDILDMELDIVGLQEVDQNTGRNKKQDTMKILSEETGYEYYGYSKCFDFDGGAYGHGILSKYPIVSYETVLLPGGGEQRAYSHAVINVDGVQVDFYNTHLTWPEKSARDKQFPLLAKELQSKQVAILVGDLNSEDPEEVGPHFPYCNFANLFGNYYVTNPEVGGGAIDNIISTANTVTQLATGRVTTPVHSDHYMLWADLQISRDSGFVEDEDGIRYYQNGEALTGWQALMGNIFYFDEQTGLMASESVDYDGTLYELEKFSFKGFELYRVSPDAEPIKKALPQEWLQWLTQSDANAEDSVYKKLNKGAFYQTSYIKDGTEYAPSAFGVTNNKFLLSYQFSDTELTASEDYTFEIWYKDADVEGDYKCVSTKAYKVYDLKGNSNVLYRLPVYDAGMDDLTTNDGKTNVYDMIVLVYDGEDLVGYKQIAVDYTESSALYRQDLV